MKVRMILILILVVVLSACATTQDQAIAGAGQVELRSYQTRAFDSSDKKKVMRSIISTLQDLNFVIDKADLDFGTITATKLSGYQVRMTVTVREKEGNRLLVRANAQYNNRTIEDPGPYQDFFTALEKSMFLTAHAVD